MDDCLIVQGQSQVGFTCIHTQKADKTLQQMLLSFLQKKATMHHLHPIYPFSSVASAPPGQLACS